MNQYSRWKLVVYLCLIFVFAPGALLSSIRAAENRPNVILIMADDLGYEALACNGGTTYETPAFDDIARRGMRFTRCYSQPVCTPSRVKIMTGQSNARNYVSFGVLRRGEVTFGNLMKAAGYKTCIAGKWQLSGNGNASRQGMWWDECGFDESCMWAYAHYLNPEDRSHYLATSNLKTSRFWNPSVLVNGKYRPTTNDEFGPDIYCDFILDFITRHQKEQFFVYFPMALTHSPFVPTPHSSDFPEKDKYRSNRKYFGDMIRYTGFTVNRIIDRLRQLDLAGETLVLFTGDNGTGRGIPSWMGDRLVVGAKALPIDAGCHVPMLAYWEGVIQPGSVCHDLIEFSDFMPTIAAVGAAELPSDRVLDGRSFLAQLRGEPGNPRESVVVHYDKDPDSNKPKFRRVRFAYDGTYKLYLDGRLYRVPDDWLEQQPIPRTESGQAAVARRKLQKVLDEMPAWEPDNSYFGDRSSKEMQRIIQLQKELARSR